ncbi:hypothetical protein [Actinoplanes sp. G11-F43]|uniref:hypothetical protein n=1 Tax=Actinoplanes sp. G11-F43 TaxID=3424130 RepID=UPI003D349A34
MTTTTSNAWDASIKALYVVAEKTDFSIDVLDLNLPFDVLADVEIGENINEFATRHEARVSIVNLSTGTRVAVELGAEDLTPVRDTPRRTQLRVPFGALANSQSGDVMQAIASYKVNAGAHTDVSYAFSEPFVVGN